MRFVFATPRKLKSTFVALRRGFDELYPVPQELPDLIGRALARLEFLKRPSLLGKMPVRRQRPKTASCRTLATGNGARLYSLTAD